VNTRTSNPRSVPRSLLHRLAVTGPARVRFLQGTGAPKIGPGSGAPSSRRLIFTILATTLTALAFTAAPALAAEASCAGLPEPGRAHEEQLRVENNSTQLPDCRVYELVSPAEKTGGDGDVFPYATELEMPYPMQAAPDGNAVTYVGEQFFEPQFGGTTQYTSDRGLTGWTTVSDTPASGERATFATNASVLGASENVSTSLLATELTSTSIRPLSPEAPPGYQNLYLLSKDGRVATPVITSTPPHRTLEEFGDRRGGSEMTRVAASADFSRVFFAANDALTPEANVGESTENNLYRWTAGRLHLVNVLPEAEGGGSEPNATLGYQYTSGIGAPQEVPGRGDENGDFRGVATSDVEHAVSASGDRAFWTDESSAHNNLYMRESYFEGGQEKERTVQVDRAVGGGGKFLDASREGERVFFVKNEQLYEYDVVSGETLDLTPSPSVDLRGLIGASENGEYVYFVAGGGLAGNATPRVCVIAELSGPPQEEKEAKEEAEGVLPAGRGCNLYVYHDGVTRFIAALSGSDNRPSNIASATTEQFVADWAVTASQRTAEVSPDGQYVAFGSHISLTGVQNAGPEIFVYDFDAGALSCVSCSPGGVSNAGATVPPLADAFGTQRQRYVLDDGRVFFTTNAALVPQDTNGQPDVYEWENGEAHLISSGTSDKPSYFADASEDGSDVFFTTSQALAPEDRDEIIDVYDARENGGFPAPALTQPCGSSADCQGAPPGAPALGLPVSSTFSGAGNLAPPAPAATVTHAVLTRAQELAKALKACKRQRTKRQRMACEAEARSKYGAKSKGKKSKRPSDDRRATR
jgi:hypothetical protein